MVISQISGGLGNQMFQYATGLALSARLRTTLLLDISGYKNYALHNGFELDVSFKCIVKIASERDLYEILGWRAPFRNVLINPKLARIRGNSLIVEPHLNYWDGIEKISSSYLSGYWQSERYFKKFIPQVREAFSFKNALTGANLEFAEMIKEGSSISLHVRRGDYVSNKLNASIYEICDESYYLSAVKYVENLVKNPIFFIFSDDIEWSTKYLDMKHPHYFVNINKGSDSYKDMQLMSLCKHHIISNSTFSWWAGWLNPDNNKIVVAPKKWFKNPFDSRDLVPPTWVRI